MTEKLALKVLITQGNCFKIPCGDCPFNFRAKSPTCGAPSHNLSQKNRDVIEAAVKLYTEKYDLSDQERWDLFELILQ